jgi:membrane protein
LQLSGSAAADLQRLMQRPPGATEPVTLLSAALLVVSVVGFTRALQRTYQAAWLLPAQGLRGFVPGLLGAAALVVAVDLVLLVGLLVNGFRGAALVTVAVNLVLSVLLWWPVQRLLLGGRGTSRQLLPGAVLSGTGRPVRPDRAGLRPGVLDGRAGAAARPRAVLGAEAEYDPPRLHPTYSRNSRASSSRTSSRSTTVRS